MGRISYGGRKAREGTVVSDKMDKTIVVAVAGAARHRLYKKIVRRLRRYNVHDETNDARLGDRVRITESRPHSRHKRWQLVEVLVRAERPEVAAEEIDLELLGEVKTEDEEAAAPVETAAEEAVAEPETAEAAEATEEPKSEGEEEEAQ
jgi:small subunit ribosomal protein S17